MGLPVDRCPSCDTPLLGTYCHACGERRPDPARDTVRSLVGQFFGSVLSLEGRWSRALFRLLLFPGQLASDWARGARVGAPRPISIFLAANLTYFLAAGWSGIYILRTRLWTQVQSTPWGDAVLEQIGVRLALDTSALTPSDEGPWVGAPAAVIDLADAYDDHAAVVSKLIVAVLIPAFALLLALAHRHRGRRLVDHLVLATHFLAWWLAVVVLGGGLLLREVARRVQPEMREIPDSWVVPLLVLGGTLWLYGAGRRFYGERSRPRALLRALLLSVGLLAIIVLPFRAIEFLSTWTTLP